MGSWDGPLFFLRGVGGGGGGGGNFQKKFLHRKKGWKKNRARGPWGRKRKILTKILAQPEGQKIYCPEKLPNLPPLKKIIMDGPESWWNSCQLWVHFDHPCKVKGKSLQLWGAIVSHDRPLKTTAWKATFILALKILPAWVGYGYFLEVHNTACKVKQTNLKH